MGNSSRLSRFNSRDLVTFLVQFMFSFSLPLSSIAKHKNFIFKRNARRDYCHLISKQIEYSAFANVLPPVRDDKNKNKKLLEELLPAARDCDHKKSAKRVNVEQPVGSCTSTIAPAL